MAVRAANSRSVRARVWAPAPMNPTTTRCVASCRAVPSAGKFDCLARCQGVVLDTGTCKSLRSPQSPAAICRSQTRNARKWHARRRARWARFEAERTAAERRRHDREILASCPERIARWHAEKDFGKKTLLYDRMPYVCQKQITTNSPDRTRGGGR